MPLQAQAQQKPRRLALVHSGIPADQLTERGGPFWVRRFHETLRRLGNIEGQNLVIERFSAEGRTDRFASVVADVIGRKPDVIVTNFNDLVKIFVATTKTTPIVALVGDPLTGGLVTNLARPGGNLTGVSINAGSQIYGKRLQILKEVMPAASTIGYLLSGVNNDPAYQDEVARRMQVTVIRSMLALVDDAALERGFSEMAQQRVDAVIIDEGGSFLAQRAAVVELAQKYRVPVMYPYRDYVERGGLIAFAPDLAELAERLAADVHHILNGAKPGDIPFYQPSIFRLIINLKAAKAIGLDIPAALVARADEVIE
ncbi:ABC transporter substrate-binding protein [Bradyrhizobium sp. AS23.2]|uniref:ABC transporter substrate-binding protein n=1 Tax=Bradyrhizobium sp. AS23.2 TaxID=1680155 RepID=UPI00143116A2|nr:ABC transporter substrate-binding protein [Bradyrhizobium sp. AS23.2]